MTELNWILLVYIVGVITAYIVSRIISEMAPSWTDRLLRLFLGVLSWLGLLIVGLITLLHMLGDFLDKKQWKGPNWLRFLLTLKILTYDHY